MDQSELQPRGVFVPKGSGLSYRGMNSPVLFSLAEQKFGHQWAPAGH